MAQWFYAKADQRLGPVETQDLQSRLEQGELNGNTLVWREGMSQWQPVREMATELAFDSAADSDVGAVTEGSAPSLASSPYAAPQAPSYESNHVTYGGEVVYAGFLKRYAAATIDSLVLGIVSAVLMVLAMVVFGVSMGWSPEAYSRGFAAPIAPLLFVLAIFGGQAAYYTWMTSSSNQATLGKMAVGIKVVRSSGETLSAGRSFGRFVAYFGLTLITCYAALLISAFMSGLTARKQGLHDMMVDSLVVDKWAFTANPERQRRELGAVTWVVIVLALLATVGYFALFFFSLIASLAGQH